LRQTLIETTETGVTAHKCVDRRGNAGDNYLIVVDMESGTGTVDFEFTPDDCIDGQEETWIKHDVLCDLTESCASTLNIPFQGFRLNVRDYKSGTIKAKVIQGGYHDY